METTKPDPRPCVHCNGSGRQARGCNIWPCDACGGTGIGEDEGPDTTSEPGS